MSNADVLNAFPTNGASPGGSKIMIPDYTEAVVKAYHASPGSYPGVVTEFKIGISKANNKMLVFDLEVDVGGGKALSKKLHCVMPVPMTANALGKIKQTCLALDVPPRVEIEAKLVVGRKCTVNLVDGNEYLGKPASDIDSIDPPGQATGAISTVTTTGPAFPVDGDSVPF